MRGVVPTPVSLPHGDPQIGFAWHHKLRLSGEIVATYFYVRWLLARRPLPDVVAALRQGSRGETGEAELAADGGWRYALSVVKTIRVLPADSRCLVRSLVLLSVLARRGGKTTLVIGVRSQPNFGAHAWIEYKGSPLLDPGDTNHGRLLEL